MTPTQWMIEPLRRYAQFTGRARRAEYWWFVLFGVIVGLVATLIDYLLGLTGLGAGTLVSLGLFVPQLAVGVRRLHDIDRSGWWLGAAMIVGAIGGGTAGVLFGLGAGSLGPFALPFGLLALVFGSYGIVLLVWACTRGTAGPNRFGPDPIAPDPHIL